MSPVSTLQTRFKLTNCSFTSVRYDADCLLKNVFEIFENPLGGGRVSPNEILWIFSMAMNGTGKDGAFSDKHQHQHSPPQPRRNCSGCSSCMTRT